MSFETFRGFDFRPETLEMIERCNAVIAEFQADGFVLTLRQLYYQMVTANLISNSERSYKRLGSIVNDGRLAGMIDWDAIEDRTRNLTQLPSWRSPEDVLQAVTDAYLEDPWLEQDWLPEVWIEKEALVGVIERTCNELRVPFFACRGYGSQSELYAAGKRFRAARRNYRRPIVFHLGDHDPSGLDMTRDNRERLEMFTGRPVELRRLALNMDQIEKHGPPPNPAKVTDARFTAYADQFGDESWELDALPPRAIGQLIEDAIRPLIDQGRWDETIEREEGRKATLQSITERYDDVKGFLYDDE